MRLFFSPIFLLSSIVPISNSLAAFPIYLSRCSYRGLNYISRAKLFSLTYQIAIQRNWSCSKATKGDTDDGIDNTGSRPLNLNIKIPKPDEIVGKKDEATYKKNCNMLIGENKDFSAGKENQNYLVISHTYLLHKSYHK